MNALTSIRSMYSRLSRYFSKNLTRAAIGLFGFISLVAVSWGAYVAVAMLTEKSAVLAHETQKERNDTLLFELVRIQQQIRIDVIRVRQSVLVYSATRAQDGHDNSLVDAAKYAEKFPQDLGAAKHAAEPLGGENLINALTRVAQLFPDYYARGVEMAKIYAAEGHSAGNKLMTQFRAQSDEMQKRLDEADSVLDTLKSNIDSSAALASKRIREARESQTLIALAGVVVTALTCLLGVLLAYNKVTQPLSWITYCFKRLEHEDYDYDVWEIGRSDEIGALARTYREFRQLALEQRKHSLEANLLAQLNGWLHSCKSLEELYEVVARFLARLLPNSAGSIYIYVNSRDVLENVRSWSGAQITPAMHPDDCWGLRRGRIFTFGEDEISFHCAHVDPSTTSDYCCIPILAHGETIGLLHLGICDVQTLENETQRKKSFSEQRRLGVACAERISIAIANVKLRDQLRDQSIRDALTGLFNRRYLLESCRREFSRAARTGQHICLLSIDVDHFKKYNDNHGHDAGDTVLRAVGECLEKNYAERGHMLPLRWRGVHRRNVRITPAEAVQRADKLRGNVESLEVHYLDRNLPRITISVGIATFPDCGDNPQAVIRAADEALYRAKENGRNRVEASTLLGLSSGGSTARSVQLQRALVEEEFDVPGQTNKAA